MKLRTGFLTALIAVLLASCGCSKSLVTTTSLTGDWTIEKALDKSTAGGENPATISFAADGSLNGCATVNRFFGAYHLKGNTLSLSNIGMTRMMGASMDIEDAITQALNKTDKIEIKGDKATIYDKDNKVVMTLKKKAQ